MTAPRLRSRSKPLPSRLRARKLLNLNVRLPKLPEKLRPKSKTSNLKPKDSKHSKPRSKPRQSKRQPFETLEELVFEQEKPQWQILREQRADVTRDFMHEHLCSLPGLKEISIDQVQLHPRHTNLPGLYMSYRWLTTTNYSLPTGTTLNRFTSAEHLAIRQALKKGDLYAVPDLAAKPKPVVETKANVDWTEMFVFEDDGTDSSADETAHDSEDGEEKERELDKEATRRLLQGESVMGAEETLWDRIDLARGLGTKCGVIEGESACRMHGFAVVIYRATVPRNRTGRFARMHPKTGQLISEDDTTCDADEGNNGSEESTSLPQTGKRKRASTTRASDLVVTPKTKRAASAVRNTGGVGDTLSLQTPTRRKSGARGASALRSSKWQTSDVGRNFDIEIHGTRKAMIQADTGDNMRDPEHSLPQGETAKRRMRMLSGTSEFEVRITPETRKRPATEGLVSTTDGTAVDCRTTIPNTSDDEYGDVIFVSSPATRDWVAENAEGQM